MIDQERKYSITEKSLIFAMIVLAIGGISIPLRLGMPNLSMLGSYLAIPMIFASLTHLIYRNKQPSYIKIKAGEWSSNLLLALYLLCFSGSIILINSFQIRPYLYYALISAMATLILLQILLFDIDNRILVIILAQIMVLVLDLLSSVNLSYHYFIGRSDIPGHVFIISTLIRIGHITNAFTTYRPFPLWHILVSSLYQIMNLPVLSYRVMFLANDLIYAFMIPLIYSISLKIFGDRKTALLSSLLTAININFLFYGFYAIPRSVTPFLEVMMLLFFISADSTRRALLLIVISTAIILYHTISMPFILVSFAIIYYAQKLYGIASDRKLTTFNFIELMAVSTLFYWMYYARQIFNTLIINIAAQDHGFGKAPQGVLQFPLSELFNYLEYSPFMFLAIVGALAALRSKDLMVRDKTILLSGLLMTSFSYPGPSLLINKLAHNLNLGRFGEYTFIFIILASGFGLITILHKSGRFVKVIVVMLFFTTAFLSVSNDFVASDNPLIMRPFYTSYLTNEETTSFDHIKNITEGKIMCDFAAGRYIYDSTTENDTKYHILEIGAQNGDSEMSPKDLRLLRSSLNDIFLIRTGELARRPLYLLNATGGFIPDPALTNLEYYYPDNPVWKCLVDFSKIYDSGHVKAYD